MLRQINYVKEDQGGFASIIIALVLIIVLSLITVGFSELMRNEQTSSLNKQLSNQAYYAAEAGINDATKAINTGFTAAKTTCGPLTAADPGHALPGAQYLENSDNVGTTSLVSYPCLLIDPAPPNDLFTDITQQSSRYVTLYGENTSGAVVPISALEVSWQDNNGGTNFRANTDRSFDTYAGWGNATGVLKISLTPDSGAISRNSLIASNYSAYLYPNYSPRHGYVAGYNYSLGVGNNGINSGVIDPGNCNINNDSAAAPRFCNVMIAGLGSLGTSFIFDMHSIYDDSAVQLTAYGPNGTQLNLGGGQTLIDSTGKSQGVLRRIQVRVASTNNYPVPDYTADVMDGICKQLQVLPADISSSNTYCP